MKNLFLLGLICVGLQQSVFANTVESVYNKDSVLPLTLQQMVIDALQVKCPQAISQYGLHEIQTELRSGEFEGSPYAFYTTSFDSRYYFDGMHPSYTRITVYTEDRGGKLNVGRIVSDVCEQDLRFYTMD